MSTIRTSRSVAAALYLTCGVAWAGLAWLFGHKAFGAAIVGGVLAAPLIGVVVGLTLQGPFERAARRGRIGIALVSLYLGAALFGVGVGAADWSRAQGAAAMPLSVLEGVMASAYGVTMSGLVLMFWPLAYLTHRLLASVREIPLEP